MVGPTLPAWTTTDAATGASRCCTTSATPPLPRTPPDRHRQRPQGHGQPSQPRLGILRAYGHRNIAAALRRNARDATRLLPSLPHNPVDRHSGTLPSPSGNTPAVCAKFVIDPSAAECLHFSTYCLAGWRSSRRRAGPLAADGARRRVQGPASRPVPHSDC